MKNWRTLILGLVICANTAFAAPQEIDQVAAVVNNGVVLQSDVDNLLQSVKRNAKSAGQQLPDDAVLRHQILDRLILDSIQTQMAQKMGVTISDADVDRAIADIAAQNHITLDQMRARLAQDGVTYNSYRKEIRKEMTLSEVRNSEVRRRVSILPQEVDSLAKQLAEQNANGAELNLSQILIPLPENPTQAEVDKAEALSQRLVTEIKRGADFAKLAASYSADPQALKGGEMGWGRVQELPSLFADKLQSATQGEVVGPIRSGVGFHILRVNAIRGATQSAAVTEVHARHILLKTSVVMDDQQARAKLMQVRQDIINGKDSFADEAQKLSQDPGSASQGGDLGWSSPDAYDPAFRDALMKLKKGEISQPVQSAFGWHLIQLLGTRQVDNTNAALKEQAYRMLFNRKFSEEVQTWLQELRAGAYVKIYGDNAPANAQ